MPFRFYLRLTFTLSLIFPLATACLKNDISGMYQMNEPPEFVRSGVFEIDYRRFRDIQPHSYVTIQNSGHSWDSTTSHSTKFTMGSVFNSYDENPLQAIFLANDQIMTQTTHNSKFIVHYDTLDVTQAKPNSWINLSFYSSSHPEQDFERAVFIPELLNFEKSDTIFPGQTLHWQKSNHPHTGLIVRVFFSTWFIENERFKSDTVDFHTTNQKIISQELGHFTFDDSMFENIPDSALCRIELIRKSIDMIESKKVKHITRVGCTVEDYFFGYYIKK